MNERFFKDVETTKEVPLNNIYNFLIQENIAKDRQMATRMVRQEMSKPKEEMNIINFDDFSRLFCKSMFKLALKNMILKLKKDGNPPGAETDKQIRRKIRDHVVRSKVYSALPSPHSSDSEDSVSLDKKKKKLTQKFREKMQAKINDYQFYQDDAKKNFMKEMPLSLQLQRFQRQKLMQGLKPDRDAA